MANARRCPNGHIMDPNWTTCPYCVSEQRARERSGGTEVFAAAGGPRTSVGPVPPSAERRETRPIPPAAEPYASGYVGEGDTRRIVGVLITYTWLPEGQLFPVREGKTFIGSGDVSSEAIHRSCDVQIPQDRRMSAEHALILCRHGAYEVIDQTSSNGTFLNGKMLRANNSTEIPHYGKIETGSTLWTFIQIEAPRQIDAVPPAPRVDPPAPRVDPPAPRVDPPAPRVDPPVQQVKEPDVTVVR
jgi:FHA domain